MIAAALVVLFALGLASGWLARDVWRARWRR